MSSRAKLFLTTAGAILVAALLDRVLGPRVTDFRSARRRHALAVGLARPRRAAEA